MRVKCQEGVRRSAQDITIGDRDGQQDVILRHHYTGCACCAHDTLWLACGHALPMSYLPTSEQQGLEDVTTIRTLSKPRGLLDAPLR